MNKLVCDISHWQGATNFSTMQRAGASAVIIKATEHTSWLDVNFERNWQAAASVGLPWAPYHYYRPNYDPIQQAHWFAEKSHFIACDFAPVYDVEEPSGIPAGYASKLLTSLVEFERITGWVPTIYPSGGYWSAYLYNALWGDQYPLWVANYRNYEGPIVPPPWAPSRWACWQFTAKFNGPKYGVTSLGVDMNVAKDELFMVERNVPDPGRTEILTAASLMLDPDEPVSPLLRLRGEFEALRPNGRRG